MLRKNWNIFSQMHKNNRGGILTLVLVFTGLISIFGIFAMTSINAIFNNYAFRKNQEDSRRVLSYIKSTLSDQRFCSSLFKTGYNTTASSIKFTGFNSGNKENNAWMKARWDTLQNSLGDYTIDFFLLTNQTTINEFPSKLRQFTLNINLLNTKKNNTDSVIRKLLGQFDISKDLSEKLYLVLGERGECYIRDGLTDAAATSLKVDGVRISSKALGGQITNGRFYTKEWTVNQLGIPSFTNFITHQSSFSYALCRMEINLLRKAYGLSPGWSVLCQKPEFSGCVNEPSNFSQLIPVGGGANRTIGMNMGDVNTYIKNRTKPTIEKRVSRLAVNYNSQTQTINLGSSFTSVGDIILSGFFGFPGALIFALLLNCDDARVTEIRVCRNNYLEIDRFLIYHQRTETWPYPHCEWEGPKIYVPPTDAQILKVIGN